MLSLDELRGSHICICTPCYGAQVYMTYHLSIVKLIYEFQKLDINLSFIVRGGDSLIPRTRNSIVAEFMATPVAYTHLLWIDADIGFRPEQVARLLRLDRDVVTGVYPLKQIAWPDMLPEGMSQTEFRALYTKYPFNPMEGARVDADGLIEVLDAPTGMMLIKRDVFETMRRSYPDLKIIADVMPGLEKIQTQIAEWDYRFFDTMTEASGRYLSEDYAFCRRWQNIGGKVYADVASDLTHHGGHVYTGNFLESITAWSKKEKAKPAPAPAPGDSAARALDALRGKF